MFLMKLILILSLIFVCHQQMYSPLPKFPLKDKGVSFEKWKEILAVNMKKYKNFEEEARRKLLQRKAILEQQRREREFRDKLNRLLNQQRQNDKSVFNDFYSGRY